MTALRWIVGGCSAALLVAFAVGFLQGVGRNDWGAVAMNAFLGIGAFIVLGVAALGVENDLDLLFPSAIADDDSPDKEV